MKIAIALILFSIPSFAGDTAGNGGGGIVCRTPSGEVKSVELLDYWEGREIGAEFETVEIDLGSPNLT